MQTTVCGKFPSHPCDSISRSHLQGLHAQLLLFVVVVVVVVCVCVFDAYDYQDFQVRCLTLITHACKFEN